MIAITLNESGEQICHQWANTLRYTENVTYKNARDSHEHAKKKLQITWKDNLLECTPNEILTQNFK